MATRTKHVTVPIDVVRRANVTAVVDVVVVEVDVVVHFQRGDNAGKVHYWSASKSIGHFCARADLGFDATDVWFCEQQ